MRLSKEARIDYAELIKNACGYLPNVFANGTFEFSDLDLSIKNDIMNQLETSEFIKELFAQTSRYDSDKYQINGILVENMDAKPLQEEVEFHDNLNPKIWTDNNELRDDVKAKILAIVDMFFNQLKEDEIELKIDDIYLIGSNANYNYTDESDLDIHIIADQSFDCKSKHLPLIYNAYKTIFNKNYDISINGINAEIYVENKDALSNVSTGVYSLNKGWIITPSLYEIPKIDDSKLEKMIQEYEEKYLDIIDNPSIQTIEKFIDDIYAIRTDSIRTDGEFGLGNLLFKEIRHLGYLDELKELKINLISKQLSL